MNKFEITFNDGDTINRKITVKANTVTEALVIFFCKYPNADYTKIEEVTE